MKASHLCCLQALVDVVHEHGIHISTILACELSQRHFTHLFIACPVRWQSSMHCIALILRRGIAHQAWQHAGLGHTVGKSSPPAWAAS